MGSARLVVGSLLRTPPPELEQQLYSGLTPGFALKDNSLEDSGDNVRY